MILFTPREGSRRLWAKAAGTTKGKQIKDGGRDITGRKDKLTKHRDAREWDPEDEQRRRVQPGAKGG